MKTKKNNTRYIVTGAIIAAMYVALTMLSNFFGLAYGPIQFRVSEVLSILPVFTPAAIPGLAVGCLISNLLSFNAVDLIFGTLATIIAALLSRSFRNIKLWNIPLLSFLPPIFVNAAIVGAEISIFFLEGNSFLAGFWVSALQVGVGQAAVCFLLGIPFYLAVKNKLKLS